MQASSKLKSDSSDTTLPGAPTGINKFSQGLDDQYVKTLLRMQNAVIQLPKGKQHFDIYLALNIFPALVPGLDALAREVERIMNQGTKTFRSTSCIGETIDQNIRARFNPCIWLAEYLLRNNPKNGHHQQFKQKFMIYARIERIRRLWSQRRQNLLKLHMQQPYAKKFKKRDINTFISQIDKRFVMNGSLVKKMPAREIFKFIKDEGDDIQFQTFFDQFYEWIQKQDELEFDDMNPHLEE